MFGKTITANLLIDGFWRGVPPRAGFWLKDLATAGKLPPADKSGRASSFEQQARTYGEALNFKRWADLEDEDDEGMGSANFENDEDDEGMMKMTMTF